MNAPRLNRCCAECGGPLPRRKQKFCGDACYRVVVRRWHKNYWHTSAARREQSKEALKVWRAANAQKARDYSAKYYRNNLDSKEYSRLKQRRCKARKSPQNYRKVLALVPDMPGRADIVQDILLAIMAGDITPTQLRTDKALLRKFTGKHHKQNFESSGYAISLSQPRRDGRSWDDVLPGGAL